MTRFDHLADYAIFSHQMLLPDIVFERGGAQPLCQGYIPDIHLF